MSSLFLPYVMHLLCFVFCTSAGSRLLPPVLLLSSQSFTWTVFCFLTITTACFFSTLPVTLIFTLNHDLFLWTLINVSQIMDPLPFHYMYLSDFQCFRKDLFFQCWQYFYTWHPHWIRCWGWLRTSDFQSQISQFGWYLLNFLSACNLNCL